MPFPEALLHVLAFVWGAIWGSFLNVCIYRLPAGMSIVRPGSRCPKCGTALKPWHNVPILSWLVLRGRCAFCRAPISPRYPLVELLTAVLSLALFARALRMAGDPPLPSAVVVPFVFDFVFVAGLVVATFIDIDSLEIPNGITLPGVVLGLVASFVAYPERGVTWLQSLLGAAVGGGALWLLVRGYSWLTRREGMGFGDFKLMAMVGAFLGVQALPFVIFASAVQGLLYALALFAAGGQDVHRGQLAALDARDAAAAKDAGEDEDGAALADDAPAVDAAPTSALTRLRTMPIPFGPFIALAALEWLFFGARVTDWIAGWVG